MDHQQAHTETPTIAEGRKVFPPAWAQDTATANAGQKLALLLLALHADALTLRCWLKLDTLAREASATKVTVRRNVDALADAGLIATIPLVRAGARNQTGSAYVLNIDGWLDGAATVEAVVALAEARSAAITGEDAGDFLPSKFRIDPQLDGLRLPFHQVS